MVKIVIENLGQKELIVADSHKTVLQLLQGHYLDWMHACGGKGRCTTCKMKVIRGHEVLSHLTPAEKKYASEGSLQKDERLACQVRVPIAIGIRNLVIRVPEDSKLPHMDYTP